MPHPFTLSSLAVKLASYFRLILLIGLPSLVFADVKIEGLTKEQETNVRALLPINSADCNTSQWRVKRLFRDADKHINNALQALGHYDVRLYKQLTWEEKCWYAKFKINPGEPIRLLSVTIAVNGPAAENATVQALLASEQPRSGDVLNHGQYEQYRDRLQKAVIDNGYFDADYQQAQVLVNVPAKTADMTLVLNSGERYYFGEITYTDNILRQELLERFSDIESGAPYDSEAVADLFAALTGSGYFGSVSISTTPLDTENKRTPVTVSLTPGNSRIYTAGIGFATDTGPQARLGYTNLRRSEDGDRIESRLFVSDVSSEITGNYRWPLSDPRKEWFNVVTGVYQEHTDTSESETFKVGLSRTRGLYDTWLAKPYLEFVFEDFTIAGESDISRLIVAGMNWESITGRELGRVRKGRLLNYDVRGASRQLGSDTSFVQFQARGKWIRSAGPETRLLARATVATTVKEDFSKLPASERFFTGGDHSIRGYDFESLGPLNQTGDVIGGSHLVEASLEVDRITRGNWSVAAFVDTGSAFNESPDFSTGIGLGLRWHSPVGPIRFDVASPLDDPTRSFRIHISVGPDL